MEVVNLALVCHMKKSPHEATKALHSKGKVQLASLKACLKVSM